MIDLTYQPENNLIVSSFHGVVTAEELEEFIGKLLEIDSEEGAMRGLVILDENTQENSISYKNIYTAGKRMRAANYRNNGKNAIVANSSLGYGLARIYQVVASISDLDEIKVYRGEDLTDAIGWLGVLHLTDHIYEILARNK